MSSYIEVDLSDYEDQVAEYANEYLDMVDLDDLRYEHLENIVEMNRDKIEEIMFSLASNDNQELVHNFIGILRRYESGILNLSEALNALIHDSATWFADRKED